VLAQGSVRAAPDELQVLRKHPGPHPAAPLPASFLKHADDQTVVGVAAVLQAIANGGLGSECFTEWGVVAAPRYFGRVAMINALQRFCAEGAWGMSPHLIPHRSLHAISGTVSQVLKIHGPNFGGGGGPNGLVEMLRAAMAMLHGDRLPALWLVLTGWEPEPVVGANGAPPADARCTGLALALRAPRPGWRGLRLRLAPAVQHGFAGPNSGLSAGPDLLRLETLLTALATVKVQSAAIVWRLDGGGRLELEREDASESLPGPHGRMPSGRRVGVASTGAGAENFR